MFALEINFLDGVSQPETIFVRRPQALIGASDYAHVVVEDMKDLDFQIRLVRDLGRKFRCKPVMARSDGAPPSFGDETYEGFASLDLGKVRLQITAIDCDLMAKENETPDRAGVRVLRQACSSPVPLFPAIVVRGAHDMVMSFTPEQPIYIGRSKQCALRLDSADISARHARMGYEGGEFWIEDLGSTNGTFVNDQQISGRVNVPAGVPIVLGREISIQGATSEDQIGRAAQLPAAIPPAPQPEPAPFPVLLSLSQVARPARLVLKPGASVRVGRDPVCDMWLGAPHISRLHCVVAMNEHGQITVTDHSTNGTGHDGGVLRKGDVLPVGSTPRVLDFGGGVTVGLCFSGGEEQTFRGANGAVKSFAPAVEPEAPAVSESAARIRSSFGAVAAEAPSPSAAGGGRLAELWSGSGPMGRVVMIATVMVVAVVLVVSVYLLIPVFG